MNAVLFKSVRLFTTHQLQFRAEVFNLTNTRQFGLLNNGRERNLSAPSQFYDFGSSNGGSRTVVLGIKYIY